MEIAIDLGLAWIDRGEDRLSTHSIIIKKAHCIYTKLVHFEKP